jgi:hypothetical protein
MPIQSDVVFVDKIYPDLLCKITFFNHVDFYEPCDVARVNFRVWGITDEKDNWRVEDLEVQGEILWNGFIYTINKTNDYFTTF